MTSRKWPASEDNAAQRLSVSAWVVLPMRAAKNGRSGRVATTMSALTQSTQIRAAMAKAGTTAAETSAGRNRAAYGSMVDVPCAARVVAVSGAGRRSAGWVSQWARSARRSVVVTSTPTHAATRSAVQERRARAAKRPAVQPRGEPSGLPSTTATMTAEMAKASAMVSSPWSTPTTARAATGRRIAGAALSSRGSKGFMVSVCAHLRWGGQLTATGLGM